MLALGIALHVNVLYVAQRGMGHLVEIRPKRNMQLILYGLL